MLKTSLLQNTKTGKSTESNKPHELQYVVLVMIVVYRMWDYIVACGNKNKSLKGHFRLCGN